MVVCGSLSGHRSGNPNPAILRPVILGLVIARLILSLHDQGEAGRRWLKLQHHMRIRAACVLRGGSRRRRNLGRANANRNRGRRVAAISVLVDGDQAVPVSFAGVHVKIGELAGIAGERIADYNSKIGLAPRAQNQELRCLLHRQGRSKVDQGFAVGAAGTGDGRRFWNRAIGNRNLHRSADRVLRIVEGHRQDAVFHLHVGTEAEIIVIERLGVTWALRRTHFSTPAAPVTARRSTKYPATGKTTGFHVRRTRVWPVSAASPSTFGGAPGFWGCAAAGFEGFPKSPREFTVRTR